MNKAQLKREILNAFYSMSEDERMAIFQNGCIRYDLQDYMIFPMDDFHEREDNRPFSKVHINLSDDLRFDDEYYYFDSCGHYHSFNNIMDSDLVNVFDDLLDYAIDDEYHFESMKIAEIYEEARSEEENERYGNIESRSSRRIQTDEKI